MPCYISNTKPASRKEYEQWQSIGYTGTWEDYCQTKNDTGQTQFFICGDLGVHCADCNDVGEFLCDYPVGDNKTCDRPVCETHSHEIGINMHYCETHFNMWQEYRNSGKEKAKLRKISDTGQ